MNEPFFCTADEIARAVVASARLFDEDPERIVQGLGGARARWYAFAALLGQFPQADYRAVARGCGFQADTSIANSRAQLAFHRRKTAWWDEGKVWGVLDVLKRSPVTPPPRKDGATIGDDAETEGAPARIFAAVAAGQHDGRDPRRSAAWPQCARTKGCA